MPKQKLIKRLLCTDFNRENPLPENLSFLKDIRPLYHAITTYQENGENITVVEYSVRRAKIIAKKLSSDDVEVNDDENSKYTTRRIGTNHENSWSHEMAKKAFLHHLNICYESIPKSARKMDRNPSLEQMDEIKNDPVLFINHIQKCINNLKKFEGKYNDISSTHKLFVERHESAIKDYESLIKKQNSALIDQKDPKMIRVADLQAQIIEKGEIINGQTNRIRHLEQDVIRLENQLRAIQGRR